METISTTKNHYINLTDVSIEDSISKSILFEKRKIKIRGKVSHAVHKIAVRIESGFLENITIPMAILIGKASINLAGIMEDRIEKILDNPPDFSEVLNEEKVKELSLLYPDDREATYPMIMTYYKNYNLSKRQCGKIRTYILTHFPNRKTKGMK